ncbi:hypothetical protein STVA_30790 [Allostella vacuolata]|nr:hypothetical protein STVA_30790 [Stella vacuolata]
MPFDLADARHALLEFAPNVWAELQGLAEGMEVPLAEAVAGFSNGRLPHPRRGCSSLAAPGTYGRNYDFDPRLYDRVMVAIQAEGTHPSVGFAERCTGRLDGMNAPGLAVGLHYVNDRDARPGLASPLIVRMVLDQCASVAEAIDLLRRIPHGLAFNYSLLDRTGDAAVVEAAPDRVAVRRGGPLACTNHFQSAEMEPANPAATGGSRRRLPPLEAWSRRALAAADLFRVLNDPRSDAFHHGYEAGFGTLHTLVAEPATATLLVGVGGGVEPKRIDLAAWATGRPLGLRRLRGRLGGGDPKLVRDRNLAGAEFRNVGLAGARFDDIDFSGAEITRNCNFRGMRIAGIPLDALFAAYDALHAEPKPMRHAYPYELETGEDGRLFVTFPDISRAGGEGPTEAEAVAAATRSLAAALATLAGSGQTIPPPSPPRPGQRSVEIDMPADDREQGRPFRG